MRGLLYLVAFITVVLIVILINELLFAPKKQIKSRLNDIYDMEPIDEEDEVFRQPLSERVIKPAYESFLKFISNVAPNQIKDNYENTINNAGSPKNVTFARIMAIQIMASILAAAYFYIILSSSGNQNIMLALFAAFLAFMIPFRLIKVKADQRQKKIRLALPDLLDLLYVSVEAGLAFDMALKKTSSKLAGPLSEEINKTLEEISKGRNRQEALRGMVTRTGVDDLSYLVTSIIQTEQLGSNIADMLRVQSASMRQKRKQRAEEAALKIPVKMLFPLVFFIFPSLFIVVLGPAMINIMNTLGNSF